MTTEELIEAFTENRGGTYRGLQLDGESCSGLTPVVIYLG